MIKGAHVILYSTDADADRAFFRDVLGFDQVDVGGRGIACTPISDEGWGRLTTITLPGGGELGIYQSAHAMVHERR